MILWALSGSRNSGWLKSLFSPLIKLEGAADAVRKQLAQAVPGSPAAKTDSDVSSAQEPAPTPADALRIFAFRSLRELAHAASLLRDPDIHCLSSLYQPEKGLYHLVLMPIGTPGAPYSRICNVLAEFGDKLPGGLSTAAYHEEHYKKILERNALSAIAKLY